ncbi:MAG: Clp protease ClpP [Acidimicrobiia bacterium]|nr:Clp protease ClpP [Acidimicrobiia bacterium]
MNRYEILSKGGRAELQIYGDIGGWDDEQSIEAKEVVETLGNMQGPVDVRINSFGGSVADGVAIYNALRRHDGEVTTHIDGVAYSIASLISMAGNKIQMASNALMMIHAPWGMTVGNAPDLREQADILDKYAEAQINCYAREGGPDKATIRGWLMDGEDHYFSAIDAHELGLVDDIVESGELTEIAASLRKTKFQQPVAESHVTPEVAAMADIKDTGDQKGAPEKDDIVAKHSKTVLAAQAAGARAEKKRRETIETVFAGFYTGDELDPVTAIREACLDDVNCSELDARRELQAYLAHKSSAPVIARESYGVQSEPTAPPQASKHLGGAVGGVSSDEKVHQAFTQAVEQRMGLRESTEGNPYTGLSLSEMSRAFAKACGLTGVDQASSYSVVSAVMDPSLRLNIGRGDIRAQHATGDFPGILANVIDKAIRVRYEKAEETWRAVARVGSVNDFRQAQRPAMSAFSDLLVVPEGGEYKHGTQSDVVEFLQAEKFGRMFAITREALLADDLQAFQDTASAMADAANAIVGDKVWDVYLNNPTLNQDATPVFDALHNNIGTAGPPSVTTFSEARRLMRLQKDPSDTRTLNLAPTLVISSPGWETEVLTLVTAQNLDYDINTGNEIVQKQATNQFSVLSPVIENRLAGATGTETHWFMQAAPGGSVPFIEVAFVRGQETPSVETREGWNVDGIEYKVRQEFGVAPLAYQPVVYNAGA